MISSFIFFPLSSTYMTPSPAFPLLTCAQGSASANLYQIYVSFYRNLLFFWILAVSLLTVVRPTTSFYSGPLLRLLSGKLLLSRPSGSIYGSPARDQLALGLHPLPLCAPPFLAPGSSCPVWRLARYSSHLLRRLHQHLRPYHRYQTYI